MTLEKLRERLDRDLTPGKLGALPATYTWAPILQVSFSKNSILNKLLQFSTPKGVIFAGPSGNGRHTTAAALVNSWGNHFLWLSGWDLDQEDPKESCEIMRSVGRLACEQGKLTLLLDSPEKSRHSMLIQDLLGRLLNNLSAGVLMPVIITEKAEHISPILRRHLMLCPVAPPSKAERRSWLKQQLKEPVPLGIDGMDVEALTEKTGGYSWQQLQDLLDHLKLTLYRQVLDNQKLLDKESLTMKEALENGRLKLSSTAVEILLNMEGDPLPVPQAPPVVQYVAAPAQAAKEQTVTNPALEGEINADVREMIEKAKDADNMDVNDLLSFLEF